MLLQVADLGTRAYAEALELQRAAARARISGELAHDLLILVEHPAVVTLGRNAKPSHLGVSAEYLASQGVELFEVERGGDVTFHGPGQLVGYPIFDLRGLRPDLHWYLRQLEESLIRVLLSRGLGAFRIRGQTGVWTDGKASTPDVPAGAPGGHPEGEAGPPAERREPTRARKVASIGVHAREWVTWHGFALNVSTDLRYFDLMVPCGIPDVRMTSLSAELGSPVPVADVKADVVASMAEVFAFDEVVAADPAELPFPGTGHQHSARSTQLSEISPSSSNQYQP